MKLTPVMQSFILHWGEMGTRWGMNRSVSQIHALLYLSDRPLPADEITETLGIARSNVSGCIKELLAWDLIQVVHVMGDRRDHFEATKELWDILDLIIDGRRSREIKPTLSMLKACADEAKADKETPDPIKGRIAAMHQFVETLDNWYVDVKKLPRPTLIKLMKMGSKIARFVGGKG